MFCNHGRYQIECDGQTPVDSKRSLPLMLPTMAGWMEQLCVWGHAHIHATSNISSVKHCSTAREASSSRHHHLNLLRFVCRNASTVCSSVFIPSSVPVHPRFVASRYKNNGETHRTAFCVARHTERLPHLGASLSGLPALQSHPPHCYSCGRFHAAACPFSSRPHRSCRTYSHVLRLYLLPYCS
jgi:hypothetical protein